jgi:uncharacterized membrane protein (UPF0127 family)
LALLASGCLAGAGPEAIIPPGVSTETISVGGHDLQVWVADDGDERNRGLAGVERLPGEIAGMLFVFETPRVRTFHMRGTPLPIDIWWFDSAGELIGSDQMEPCLDDPCPTYSSPGEVGWALETSQGDHDFPTGAVLSTG